MVECFSLEITTTELWSTEPADNHFLIKGLLYIQYKQCKYSELIPHQMQMENAKQFF